MKVDEIMMEMMGSFFFFVFHIAWLGISTHIEATTDTVRGRSSFAWCLHCETFYDVFL